VFLYGFQFLALHSVKVPWVIYGTGRPGELIKTSMAKQQQNIDGCNLTPWHHSYGGTLQVIATLTPLQLPGRLLRVHMKVRGLPVTFLEMLQQLRNEGAAGNKRRE
jgi:hypothetical protein